MSDLIENVTPDAEVTAEEAKIETVESSELDKLVEGLKKDNFKQREELRTLKATLKEVSEAKTLLEEAKSQWEQELAQRKASEREAQVLAELDKANITEESARKLALTLLKDYNDVTEGITTILTDYPILAGKSKVVLPDTGKATTKDTPVADKDKLASGLAQLIKPTR